MTFRHQQGPRWQHRPLALAQSSMVSGTTDINIDPGFSRATDPGMILDHNLGLDDTMAPCGSTGHPNQPGPGCGTALGHSHGHRLWPRPRGFGVAPSSNTGQGHQPRTWSWHEHGPRHGPQQKTGSSCHHGPTWLCRPPQIGMAPVRVWHLGTNVALGSSLDHRPLHAPPSGNRSHRHQHRSPQLLQGHRSRPGPWL